MSILNVMGLTYSSVMSNAHRLDDIRRRALNAAAGVALFAGSLACGEVDVRPLSMPEGAPPPKTALAPATGASVHVSVFAVAATDAGVALDAGQAGSADASSGADAGAVTCNSEMEDYAACCAAIGWDWERGCMAWGPPVPPAAEVA